MENRTERERFSRQRKLLWYAVVNQVTVHYFQRKENHRRRGKGILAHSYLKKKNKEKNCIALQSIWKERIFSPKTTMMKEMSNLVESEDTQNLKKQSKRANASDTLCRQTDHYISIMGVLVHQGRKD